MTCIDPIRRNNVRILGKPDAKTALVFVHGFGAGQSSWRDVAMAFLADYRVVLLENARAGAADPAALAQHRYLNLRRYASDLVEVCAALALERPILIGHSMGAMICALATLERPGLAKKLVMLGASPRYIDSDDYHGGFSRGDVDAICRGVATRYSEWANVFAAASMAHADRPALSTQFAQCIKSTPQDRALTVLCSSFQSDHREDIARLDVPTLLFQAKADVAVPNAVAEYLNQHIRGSRLEMVDAEGHLPHISFPAAVVAAIGPFIRD
jgi:sigma-B regulation protein RsbQ